MFLATINKSKQLVHLSFIGEVKVEELVNGYGDLAGLLDELSPGFRVLADLERLDSMSVGCAAEIGKAMEMCERKGVGWVVRVIPDSTKDIGMGILSFFHYRNAPRINNCATIMEAAKLLGL